jgi:hypothetical protein
LHDPKDFIVGAWKWREILITGLTRKTYKEARFLYNLKLPAALTHATWLPHPS